MSAPPDVPRQRALPSRSRVHAVFALVASTWVLLDQATKVLAVAWLSGGHVVDLGALDLRLVRNPGGAFGIPGFPGLFVGVTVIVLVMVARALPRADRLSLSVAYGLVVGGALGNVVDRVLRPPGFPVGHVIDFIDLRWWPVFNLADVGIVSGAALILLLMIIVDRDEQAAERRRAMRRAVRPETSLPRQ